MPVHCTQPACPQSDTREVLPRYGWQIALTDVAALAVAVSTGSLPVSAAVYLFDGAVIHGAHGQPGRAAVSVLLRASLPLAGAYILAAAWEPDDEIALSILLGFGLGLATASVLDAALLAGSVTTRRKATAWAPHVSATHDRVTLGIAGGF